MSSSTLTESQKIQILINQGLTAEEAKQAVANGTLSASQTATTATTTGLTSAFKGLWTTLKANPLILVATAVTAGITILNKVKDSIEEVRQATEESASAYAESASSIDDYISQYEELQTALKDAKGNEEETYAIKQQLLDLQTELNDKYGDEYGKINLVTDAYNDQTEALKALNKEEANRFLNENSKGISTATKQMTKERDYVLSSPTLSIDTPDGKALKEIVDSYADEGMRLIEDSTTGTMQIVLEADAETAYETLNDFETDLRNKAKELGDEHLFDDILNLSSDALDDAKEVVDKYGEIYNQALMAKLVTDNDKSALYGQALDAVEAYNEAVLQAEDPFSDEDVAKARKNLEDIKSQLTGEEWEKYGSIIKGVFDQADTSLLEFNDKLLNDTSLQEYAEQIRDLSEVELLSMANDGTDDAFDSLIESAKEYGLEVGDVIDALVRLGYIQGDVANQDVFSENTISLEDLNDQIDSIQSAFKGLTTACEEYNQYGYITADTLQTLLNMDGQYLACLINENGQLAINGETYEKLVQAKLADAEATAVQQAIDELGAVTVANKTQADVTATQVTAEKAKALAALSGSYGAVATSAAAAAQAEALYNAFDTASGINAEEADRIMSNLNAKLALIQNTAKNTSGSFGALTNHLNGFTNATGKATDATDKFIESLKETKEKLEAQRDEYDNLYDAIQWFYDKQLDGLDDEIEGLERVVELLEKQRDNLDDIMEAMKSVYQDEIDALQEKADALDNANEKAEIELRLEEAKRKILEANSRKTKLLYQKGVGFTYVEDSKAISEAQSEYDDANADKVKQDIKEQQDLLQSYIDKLDEIPDAYDKAMREVAASKYLGADWKTAILNPSDDLFENLELDYTGIESNIAKNEDKIDSIEKEKERIQELKDLWEDAKNKYIYDNYEAQLASFFGSDYEYQLLNNSAKWRRQFADEYSSICAEIESLEKQIQAASEETTSTVESGAGRLANTLKETGNLSQYVWTDEDTVALEKAQERLDALNLLVERGGDEYIASRDSLAEFISEYENLRESGEITEGLRAKTVELNDEYSLLYGAVGSIGEGLATRLGIFDTSTESIISNVQGISQGISDADNALQGAKTSEAEVATDTSNIVTDIQGRTSTLAETSEQLKQNLEGVKNSEEAIEQQTLDTMSGIQERQITIVGTSAELKENLDGVVASEAEVEQTADETVANIDTTISNLLTKLGELKTALGEIKLGGEEVETIADEELLDTSTVVDGVHTKVGEIQTAISTLLESITPLEGALDTLMQKLTTLDEVTLSNVIGAFGGASGGGTGNGGNESKSSSKGSEKGGEESGGGTGLLAAVKAVDEAIGSTENTESLLGKLAQVDASKLENIIAQFGLSGEDGDAEGENLLSAVNAVSQAIVGGKDDKSSLIYSIEQLGSETTIGHVTTVTESFNTLLEKIGECIDKIGELADKITSLPSVSVDGYATGTRNAKKGLHEVAEEGAEIISDGKNAVLAATPTLMNMKGGETVYNADETKKILGGDGLEPVDVANILPNEPYPNIDYTQLLPPVDFEPKWDFAKGILNDNIERQPQQTVIQINGDISLPNIRTGNDAELLMKDLSNMANKARQRSAKR